MITRSTVADQLKSYLSHRMTLTDLADWAERAMMEEEFDPEDCDTLRYVISQLGLGDVRAFGLTWEDCESFLRALGYKVRVEVTAA